MKIEQIVEPVEQVIGGLKLNVHHTFSAESEIRIAVFTEPAEIGVFPCGVREPGDGKCRIDSGALMSVQTRIAEPAQGFEFAYDSFGGAVGVKALERVKRSGVKEFKRRNAVSRCVIRVMRCLAEESVFRILKFAKCRNGGGAQFRIAFKMSDCIKDICGIGTAVLIGFPSGKAAVGAGPGGDGMLFHRKGDFVDQRLNIHLKCLQC